MICTLEFFGRQWFDLSQLSGFIAGARIEISKPNLELQSLDFHSVSSGGIHWGLVNPSVVEYDTGNSLRTF